VIRRELTAARVAEYFAHHVKGAVTRYDVPGIHAVNFVLEAALAGGGMSSMRLDPLAKGFAQMLLDFTNRRSRESSGGSYAVRAAWI
jgi:hypothetical protein